MAVWWVDPYADANIGGIHGTVDITTRSGTYAYPFKLSDVAATSSTGLTTSINGNTISTGDEFRIKGLANREAFLIDLGNTWYNNNGYRQYDTNTSNTAVSSLGSSWPSTAGTWGSQNTFVYDPAITDRYTQKSAGNFKPLHTQKFVRNSDTYWYHNYGYNSAFGNYFIRARYPNSTYANQRWYALDPDYVVPWTNNYFYFLCLSVPITVTDGWTSETTRNGYNFIRIASNTTSFHYFYLNDTGNSNANATTLYDMPDTGWDFHNSSSTSPNGIYYFVSPASSTSYSTYAGYSYTQKPGAMYGSNTYSSYVYDYTGQYYRSSAYQSTSNNSSDFTLASGNWFYSYARYGSNTASTYVTRTYRNVSTGYYPAFYVNYGGGAYYNLGSICTGSNAGNGSVTDFVYVPGTNGWVKLLDGSHYSSTSSVASLLDNDTQITSNWFIDSVDAFANTAYNGGTHVNNPSASILNYSNDSSSSWYAQYQYPKAVSASGGQAGLLGNSKYAASDWWENGYIKGGYIYNDQNLGAYVISQSMGTLDTEGSDYTTTDGTLVVQTQAYARASNTGYLQYPSFHFSRNTYDGKPIVVLPPDTDANAVVGCIGYNNDSNGFCVQSNPNNNNDYFIKDFEIVLPTYDPSTQNIRIDCVYRYENLNGNGITGNSTMYYYYADWTGGLSLVSTTLVASNTSNTTAQTTITGSNMAQGDNKLNHIVARLYFRNYVPTPSTPDRGRIVIVSLTATTV